MTWRTGVAFLENSHQTLVHFVRFPLLSSGQAGEDERYGIRNLCERAAGTGREFIAGEVFGDSTLGYEIAGGAVNLAKEKLGDSRRHVMQTGKWRIWRSPFLRALQHRTRATEIDRNDIEQVARDILTAVSALRLGDEIAKAGRKPRGLAAAIIRALPVGADIKDETLELVVVAFASGLCRIADELPAYEEGKDRQLFQQLDDLLSSQERVEHDITAARREIEAFRKDWQTSVEERHWYADWNKSQYRAALHDYACRVKLLGLEGDRHEPGRRLPIEVAYVPLRLSTRSRQSEQLTPEDEITDVSWPEILALLPMFGNRLLIEGIGGSGKTTLLQWTAVEALSEKNAV